MARGERPQSGEHDVWTQACEAEQVGQEYRVRPSVECANRREADGVFQGTFDRAVADYCQRPADCQSRSGGVCVGFPSGSCEYSGVEPGEPCQSDTDCQALPEGSCVPSITGGGAYCYPTGVCESVAEQSCNYAAWNIVCSSDAECTAAPGGRCQLEAHFTQCSYNECEPDSDCGPAARCECFGVRQCVRAACFSDADCGADLRCEPSQGLLCGNLNPPVGYYCHTEQDECRSDADCTPERAPSGAGESWGSSCVYDPALTSWACRDVQCLTR